jgi:hypothetical protein
MAMGRIKTKPATRKARPPDAASCGSCVGFKRKVKKAKQKKKGGPFLFLELF